MDESKERDRSETPAGREPESPGLTRRQWILRLGEAAVLGGFSGAIPETLASPLTVPSNELPPGLYAPSGEHMAHVLLREARFVTPPAGSETEYAAAATSPFEPAFFSREEFNSVRRLVAILLNRRSNAAVADGLEPVDEGTLDEIAAWIDLAASQAAGTTEAAKSLSAQHRELAAHFYGEETVRRLESDRSQVAWRDGLAWLDQESRRLGAKGFVDLDEARQIRLLDSISDPSGTAPKPRDGKDETPGPDLYRLLKAEGIRGYYTSRPGLKELDYKGNAFHAESPGCPKQ